MHAGRTPRTLPPPPPGPPAATSHPCCRPLQINLTESVSSTLPFENGRQVRTIAVSPDGRILLSIDDEGRAVVVRRRRRALLHHFSFKGPVRAAKFSPDGKYVACAVGRLLQVRAPAAAAVHAAGRRPRGRPGAAAGARRDGVGGSGRLCACRMLLSTCLPVRPALPRPCPGNPTHPAAHPSPCPARSTGAQVWKAPGLAKTVAPMELHRTYGHCHADITALDWSADSLWLAAGGKDLSTRLFSMHPLEGYRPPTLAGHREPLVAGGAGPRGAGAGSGARRRRGGCLAAGWRCAWLRGSGPAAPASAAACACCTPACSALHLTQAPGVGGADWQGGPPPLHAGTRWGAVCLDVSQARGGGASGGASGGGSSDRGAGPEAAAVRGGAG